MRTKVTEQEAQKLTLEEAVDLIHAEYEAGGTYFFNEGQEWLEKYRSMTLESIRQRLTSQPISTPQPIGSEVNGDLLYADHHPPADFNAGVKMNATAQPAKSQPPSIDAVICNSCSSKMVFVHESANTIRTYHSCKDGVQVKSLLAEAEAKGRREGELTGIQQVCAYLDIEGWKGGAACAIARFLPQPTPEETLRLKIDAIIWKPAQSREKMSDAIMAEFDKVIASLKGGK